MHTPVAKKTRMKSEATDARTKKAERHVALDLTEVNAVLFDLDGVLIDSFDTWFHIFNDTLERFGFSKISRAEFRKHWGQSTAYHVQKYMPRVSVEDVRKYLEHIYPAYAQKHLTVDSSARPTLLLLAKKGFKTACITNSHKMMTDTIIKKYSLDICFHTVVTADDTKRPKPSPDMLFLACKLLGTPPERCIFIGDTETDMRAGKSAGCITIGYRKTVGTAGKINALDELIAIIHRQPTS